MFKILSRPSPEFSRTKVNRAGKLLRDENTDIEKRDAAWGILNNWRASHGYPINTFQSTLRDKLKRLNLEEAIVAQRLKRAPSIINKLKRERTMALSLMQDIGGLRAVVTKLTHVYKLKENYQNSSLLKHELVQVRDYINSPKTSGYRSIHLIYKYKNEKTPAYNGLLLELQIRTKIQHAWATAVETMGIFLGEALKSSEGSTDWLDFFTLTSSAFAYLEGTPLVPGFEGLSKKQTFKKVLESEKKLNARNRLEEYSLATEEIESAQHRYKTFQLIILDPIRRSLEIIPFGRDRLEEASAEYTKIENKIEKGDRRQVVLVSTKSIKNLKKAYPNYFLDTKQFIRNLNKIIGSR